MEGHPLRIAFFVQSEGRGHMTQALALKGILEDAGHEVVAAFMGEKPDCPLPGFFLSGFGAPVHTYLAPVFVVNRRGTGVRPWDSFFQAVGRFPRYWTQAPDLHQQLTAYRPHLLVNFYDLIGGLYKAVFRPRVPMVTIGHQFLFFHPEFRTPRSKRFQVEMIRLNTLMSSLGSELRVALSFSDLHDLPDRRIRVVPPLLRKSVLEAQPFRGPHILAYVLLPGYSEEIMAWHKTQSDVELHCFWDRRDVGPTFSPWDGLTFHRLDDKTFLELLVSCRGFTSTAGFESVAEAAFLGKPISLVPTGKHTEQLCNALDAKRAGVATWREDFDLSDFLPRLDSWPDTGRDRLRAWVRSAPDTFLRLLEGVGMGRDGMRITLGSQAAAGRGNPRGETP